MTRFAAKRFAAMSTSERARLVELHTAWCATGCPELPQISDADRDLLYYLTSLHDSGQRMA